MLADLPWSALGSFRRAGGVRLTTGHVVGFEMHGTVARQEWHSVLEALGLWVAEADADDPMQEYFTAEEAEEELEPDAAAAEPQPGAEQAELLALRARVAELEAPSPACRACSGTTGKARGC